MGAPFGQREWYRRSEGKMIAGVAVGLSETFGLPLAFVRLMFVLSLFLGGGGLIAYLACWLVMPLAPSAHPSTLSRASGDGHEPPSAG